MNPMMLAAMLGSSALSFVGNRQSVAAQNAANQANLNFNYQQQTGQFLPSYYKNLVAGAGSAGLSPLAVLGVNPGGGPGAIVQSADAGAAMKGLGQDLSRSAQTLMDSNTKGAELDLQAKRLQIAALENDVIAGQLRNSHNIRTLGSPGSPPTWAAGSAGSPFFGPVNPYAGPHPDLIRTSSGEIERSREQAEIGFSGDPWMMAKNAYKSLGRDIDYYYMPWMSGLRDDMRRNVQPFTLDTAGGG